jgi:transposase-like protein
MKKDTSHRLNRRQWIEIVERIKNKTYSISELAKRYNVNRSSIYSYCWRHGILKKVSKRD